jgi:hypothetical protein
MKRFKVEKWIAPSRRITKFCIRFEVYTAMKMLMLVFWVVMPCGLVDRCKRFGRTYCLHLQGW